MGANTDPQSMQAAIDQLQASKKSRKERAGTNERREKKAPPRRPMPEFGEQEGRPGIRPPKPPRDEPKIPGRPPGGRGDVRIQPFPFPGGDMAKPLPWFPPRGDDQYGPGRPFPGRPIGDDQFPPKEPPFFEGPLPGPEKPIEGRPPKKPFPGRPIGDDQFPVGEDPIGLFPIPGRPPGKPPRDVMPGRPKPPVEEHPWGKEDDPNYGKKKDQWHQKRRNEDKRRMDFKERLMRKTGGIDFGPGRSGRVDRDATRKQMEAGNNSPVPGGEFLNPEEGLKGQEYMAFIERLLRQKQGQFNR